MENSLSVSLFCRYAAVYLCAGTENLLEELVLLCLPPAPSEEPLTAAGLEHAIANSADLWGLLQPYAHLNAGRTAAGKYYYYVYLVKSLKQQLVWKIKRS